MDDFCEIEDILSDKCILNSNNTNSTQMEINYKIIESIEKGFTSPKYNTSNLDNGIDETIKYENFMITLTTIDNQKNNSKNDNTTNIDLSECERILRDIYNISDDEKIYMLKKDVEQTGMKIPKIEYDVYYKLNGSLSILNLFYCKDIKADLFIPVEINESIDILNSSSGYYNDICYTTNSNSGTDISLKDRKKEYVNGNKTICQEDCDFSEYDTALQKAKCSCEIKQSSSSIIDMSLNKTKLFENFKDIKNFANFNFLICHKNLLNKKGIINNISLQYK